MGSDAWLENRANATGVGTVRACRYLPYLRSGRLTHGDCVWHFLHHVPGGRTAALGVRANPGAGHLVLRRFNRMADLSHPRHSHVVDHYSRLGSKTSQQPAEFAFGGSLANSPVAAPTTFPSWISALLFRRALPHPDDPAHVRPDS